MGRKSGPRQLKREPAPGFWPIHRKETTWAPRTRPGPHIRERSLPIVIVVREILGYAKTAKEALRIIKGGKISLDGVVRKDHRFPVGLMDVLKIQGISQTYRVLPKPGRGLVLSPIEDREAGFKICKIVGKRTVSGGRLQISFHDGRNILAEAKERQKEEELQVGGAVQLALPSQKVVKYVPFQVGAVGLVTDGRNQGLHGKIASISAGSYARPKIAKIETPELAFDTPAAYVIPIGMETPLISLDR